ncbi:hypothetical protein PC116_g21789 [Phytophthora cactorum]|nr:hypothetical protein PC116_g21789 [Phytophthora cactorum]
MTALKESIDGCRLIARKRPLPSDAVLGTRREVDLTPNTTVGWKYGGSLLREDLDELADEWSDGVTRRLGRRQRLGCISSFTGCLRFGLLRACPSA